MVDITVSFVLYETPIEEVTRAIDQVHASIANARIVLVDNSPKPNPLPPVRDGQVTLIRPGRNGGYGSGHNLAFGRSSGDRYHAVLNTDLTYGPEVFPALISFMDAHPDVGLAMPKVVYPDGSTQYLCRLLPHPLDVFARGFLGGTKWTQARNDRYEFRKWSYDRAAEFPFLSGCFMMLRRSVIEELGGFDERFFMYGEDADLSRRITRAHRTMFVPAATVQHEYRSQAGGWRRRISKIVNLSRYFGKWGWWTDRERDALNQRSIAAITRNQ
jgi:GT2 family glycosyltransferase